MEKYIIDNDEREVEDNNNMHGIVIDNKIENEIYKEEDENDDDEEFHLIENDEIVRGVISRSISFVDQSQEYIFTIII